MSTVKCWIAIALFVLPACSSYKDSLARGQHAFEESAYERALGIFRSMEADAFQTTACWWLSVAALIGVALNGLFSWWWADPLSALVIAALIVKEGRSAWEGERDCC